MKRFIKKLNLNQRGFSHHLILPVIVVLAVAAVGIYILASSKAAELPSGSTNNTTAVHPSATSGVFPCSVPYPKLSLGSKDKCVYQLKYRLSFVYLYKGSVNTTFDNATQAAVKSLQTKTGLVPTGKVDPTTWEKLDSYFWDYATRANIDNDAGLGITCKAFTVNGQSGFSGSLDRTTSYSFGTTFKNVGTTTWINEGSYLAYTAVSSTGAQMSPDMVLGPSKVLSSTVKPNATVSTSLQSNLSKLKPGRYYIHTQNLGLTQQSLQSERSYEDCGVIVSVN